ncbi:lamin tail domain-containing protein [uncultured Cyclobacterium sp.]|uniref:lamin tail domain-containing protein n=1 Tax=uncultured Cyclobacterium sp. TaxID=453820 RepID=UPI0030EEC40B|tara:strand:- start:7303 stop:12564 length:5262 start_codon:yes stop_codon:yes gene_type:complete
MKTIALIWTFIAIPLFGFSISPTIEILANQDFEADFTISSYPDEFLPGWSANLIRAEKSRVFQAAGEGIANSKALGIQTTGTFNAQIYIKTLTVGLQRPTISFWAKTKNNGSGNRTVTLTLAFSTDQGNSFSDPLPIGTENSFPNEDTAYQLYSLPLPDSLSNRQAIMLKLEVIYGKGAGSAARLFLDDFSVSDSEEQIESLTAKLLNTEKDSFLLLEFNQPVSLISKITRLDNTYGQPSEVSQVKDNQVLLKFDDYLYNNTYQIVFEQIKGLVTDKTYTDWTFRFDLNQPTPQGAIVINEIMPDPNSKGLEPPNPILPNAEYIELFNRTDKPIRLDNFTYNEVPIPQVTLDPQTYLILCSNTNQDLFQPFGQVAGMETFKTLVNSGGDIIVKDGFGNLIDSLQYDHALYADSEKVNGGWSIEQVNPFLTCNDPYNWKASQAKEGGTPGKINDRFSEAADPRIFEVLKILPLTSGRIQLSFSKTLPKILSTETTFSINGQELELVELKTYTLLLLTPAPLISGESYQLDISNLQDCNTVPMEESSLSFTYDGSPPVAKNVWGIDEKTMVLIFDEAIDPVEAIKAANYQLVQNKEITFKPSVTEEVPKEVQLGLSDALIIGETYQLKINNIVDLSGNQILSDTISFKWEDVLDTVMVYSPNTVKVIFSETLNLETATNPENYQAGSGLTHPVKVLQDQEEKNTFMLVFDAEIPENEMQHLLVRGIKDTEGKNKITLKKAYIHDTRPIILEQIEIPTNQSLLLTFNKALDPKWAFLPQVYRIEDKNEHPHEVEMPNKHQVLLQFPFKWITGEEYQLTINGLEDGYGGKLIQPIKRSFIWDTLAPAIDTAFVINPYALEIIWSKSIDAPDTLLINEQLYTQFELTDAGRKIMVTNEEGWPITTLEIKLPLVTSKTGEAAENLIFTVDNRLLSVAKAMIWDEESILINFTKFYDPATVIFREQYKINGEFPKGVGQENSHQVRLSLSDNLTLGKSIFLEIAPIQDVPELSGNLFQEELRYEDGVDDLWLENEQQLLINHEAGLQGNQPWLNNFHFIEEEYQLEPFLSQTHANQIQVLISPPLPTGLQLTLKIPPRILNSERILPGSLRVISWNPLPPKLLEVVVLPDNQLALYFDKKLDPILATVPQFYSIGNEAPMTVYLEDDGKGVILEFEATWSDRTELSLEIRQLEDLDGNEIDPIVFTFVYQQVAVPSFKDLLINEVMPAPREGSDLPASEYIEIFNSTDSTFNLGGMKLANSRNQSLLPREEIKPGEHVILCPIASVASFTNYGKVIGLSPWPALLNGGDELSLLNHKDELVDKMNYGPEIPLASEVLTNGYSLELVNPWSTCEGLSNYAPSRNAAKGTPGSINSVFDNSPDRIAPQLIKAFVRDKYQIVLQFSKPSAENTGEVADFEIAPSIKIQSAVKDPNDPFQWILSLADSLKVNQSYEITVENWRGCSGNALDKESNTAFIKIPGLPAEGDIVLNEILFNPPSGAPKFVEIYNNSSKLINLKNWKLANATDGQVDNRKIISAEDLILEPFSYLALTTDRQSLITYFPKAVNGQIWEMSLPSYPIRSGTVILLDAEEKWVEKFDYDEDYHHGFLRNAKGISLERYALDKSANEPNNWHSAAGTENFATPGYKNSQVYDGNAEGAGLTISPEIFVPDAAGEQPFTTISYKMDQPNYQATLRIFTPTGIQIKLLCQNEIWASNGFYTWDGSNEKGEKVAAGYYIISAELFHPNGHVQHIKKTVVVGAKF